MSVDEPIGCAAMHVFQLEDAIILSSHEWNNVAWRVLHVTGLKEISAAPVASPREWDV